MNENYLWDRTGEPDPEVARLENLLQDLRWVDRPPIKRHWYQQKTWLLAAAAILLTIGVTSIFIPAKDQATSWQLSLAGQKPSVVHSGQVIETGRAGATIRSEFIGEVAIDANSRLRMLPALTDQHTLALDHGTIHATIWAPPTKFVVDTPAAKTVDLGCQYTLTVDKSGAGFLRVEVGWVAFQQGKIESFIPEGAACTTHVGHGPDTPYFLDAPPALTKALAQFDLTGDAQSLSSVLAAARPHDALTLWHLLERTQGADRIEVFDRFATLVNLPPTVTRERILANDRQSLDAAWDALQLGDTGWWREWKRNW